MTLVLWIAPEQSTVSAFIYQYITVNTVVHTFCALMIKKTHTSQHSLLQLTSVKTDALAPPSGPVTVCDGQGCPVHECVRALHLRFSVPEKGRETSRKRSCQALCVGRNESLPGVSTQPGCITEK